MEGRKTSIMEPDSDRLTDGSKSESIALTEVFNDSRDTMLFTKLMAPSPPLNGIYRPLLTSRLEEILNKKLTVISAPAGYGKTTLVSMWMTKKGTSIRIAWVSLDAKDNDIQTIWKYILMALEKSVSGTVENYMSTDFSIMADSIKLLINGLLNKLSQMTYDIVLVMDDYHIISEESIHDSIQYFIKHLPHNIHVVITSRTIPAIKLARLRGHGDLLELNTEDLRLTSTEVSEFLAETMKLSLDETEVSELEEWTEGWIAALNLTALTIKNCSNARSFLNEYSHINDYLVEYMSEEMFNQLETVKKNFLLKTSILDTLNCSLCNAVVGVSNSQEMIDTLEKNNNFTNALDNKRNNYRYHSIFANFLKGKLMESFKDIVEELYLRASQWYEENGLLQEALEYSQRVNNYGNTIRLIEKYGEIMIINRDLVRLAGIIEALPKQMIVNNSKLCVLYTMAVAGRNSSGNSGIFVGDTLVSLESGIFTEDEDDLLLIQTIIAYATENFKAALEYGNKILDHLSEDNLFRCLLYKILIQILCVTGDSEKAEACLNNYISAIKRKNYYDELFIEIVYTHTIVHILCGVGRYKESMGRLCKFEEKLNSYNILMPAAVNSIYLDLGYIYYEFGKMELSYNSVIKCIEISRIKTDVYRLISGYILVARIKQNIGKYDEMTEYVKKAIDLCDKHSPRMMIYNIIYYIVRTLLSAGQIKYAESLIAKYDIRIQDSFDVLYEEAHFALADLYLVKSEFERVEYILDKLYGEVIETERDISLIRIMILRAILSSLRGNESEALRYMEAALEKASNQGYISTFSDFGMSVAGIICKLIEVKIETDSKNSWCSIYSASILLHIKKPRGLLSNTDPASLENLSKREIEVLNYLLIGHTNKEISTRLNIAKATVKKHINNIYARIGAVNRI